MRAPPALLFLMVAATGFAATPLLTITAPADVSDLTSVVEVTGRVSDPSGKLSWSIPGTKLGGDVPLARNGLFSFRIMTEGLHLTQTVRVVARSSYGQTAERVLLLVDAEPGPVVTVEEADLGPPDSPRISVSGRVSDPAGGPIEGWLESLVWSMPPTGRGGRISVAEDGRFVVEVDRSRPARPASLWLRAEDRHGHLTLRSITLAGPAAPAAAPAPEAAAVVSAPEPAAAVPAAQPAAAAPGIEILSPVGIAWYRSRVSIEGRVQDPENGPNELAWKVSGDGGPSGEILVDSDGSFRLELATGTLAGERLLAFTGERGTGETASASVVLRDGRLPPEIRIAQPAAGGAYGSQLVLAGSVVDPYAGDRTIGGISSLSWEMTPLDASSKDGTASGTLALDPNGGFRVVLPTRERSGLQMVSVVAVGASGNRGRATVRITQGGSDVLSFAAVAGDASVTLRWDAVAAGTRCDLLYAENAAIGDGSRARVVEDVRSPLEVRGLANGSRYVFRLRTSRSGEPEGRSSDLEAVPLNAKTLIPTANGEYGGVRLTWMPAPGVKAYEVWRSARSEGDWEGVASGLSAATWLDAGAAAGLTYWYRVRPGIEGAIASEAVPGSALKFAIRALEPAGSLALDGARAVAVSGEYAWVCCGSGGLRVVDLSDPSAPRQVASLALPDARAVAVSGTLACVADGERGLVAVDASEPRSPREIGARYLPDPRAVALRADVAYVACATGGVRLVDVSDPRTPVRLGALESPDARAVCVRRDLLLVGDAASGLAVYTIATPREPRPIAALPVAGARWVHESSGRAVVVGTGALTIVDLGDPAHPSVLATIAGPASCAALTGDGYAVVAAAAEVKVLDAARSSARPIDTAASADPLGIAVAGELACVVGAGGLQLFAVRVEGRPAVVGEAALAGNPARIAFADGRAYVAARSAGLLVFSTLEQESRRAFRPAAVVGARFAEGVAVAGKLAYVADGAAGLRIVELPPADGGAAAARELSSFRPGGVVHSVAVDGALACVAAGSGGVLVLDVSDPAVPRQLASIVSPDARDVALEGSMLLVADASSGLRFFDLSAPDRPVESQPALRPAFRLSAGKGWALAVGVDGVHLVEWSGAAAPRVAGFYRTEWAEDAVRVGDRLLVAEGHRGLTVVDLSDPSRPRVVSARRDLYAAAVDAGDGCVLIAGAGSLKALEILVPPWLEQ